MEKKNKRHAEDAFHEGYNKGYSSAYEKVHASAYEKGYNARDRFGSTLGYYAVGVLSGSGGANAAYNWLAKKVSGALGTPQVGEAAKNVNVWDLIKGAPEWFNEICGKNASCLEKINKNFTVSNTTATLLAAAGISLAVYLYTTFQGTDEEKRELNRKLRQARRMTEETSDKRIKRRRTSKLRRFTELDPSISENSLADSMTESMSESMTESKSRKRKRSSRRRR